jgi:hypothetical protein
MLIMEDEEEEDDGSSVMSDVSDVTSPTVLRDTKGRYQRRAEPEPEPSIRLTQLQTPDHFISHTSSYSSEQEYGEGGRSLSYNPVSSVSVIVSQSKNEL